MADEIERKFQTSFDKLPPEVLKWPSAEILQGYITRESGGNEVRLRKKGSQYFLTVKSGSGISRKEYETEITAEQFETLWPAANRASLEKKRFTGAIDGQRIELDRYSGGLEGLVIVEVEFPDLASAQSFEPPEWFGLERTDDQRFRNKNLVGQTFSELA